MSIKTMKKVPEPMVITETLSRTMQPLCEAFHCSTNKEAVAFLKTTAMAAFGKRNAYKNDREPTKAQTEYVCTLMRSLKPTDALETLLASQIVITHLLGTKNIAKENTIDKRFGLRLLKFSAEVASFLSKKRSVSKQKISIFHHVATPLPPQPQLEEVSIE